jgi:hypothetical protein
VISGWPFPKNLCLGFGRLRGGRGCGPDCGKGIALPIVKFLLGKGPTMIDFVIAAILYIGIMFVVFFSVSFVTIGISYAVAAFIRRCFQGLRTPDLSLN